MSAPPRPLLLSACFFVLGIGTLLPWSTSVVTLPWLALASRRAPAPSAAVADSLLGALTLTLSLSNAGVIILVARLGLTQRLPPAALVPAPLVGCAALAAGAALAAAADASGTPLGGVTVVALALPAALVQGVLTAFLNCGVAAAAAQRAPRVMRAFTSGQALAGLAASTSSLLAAAAAKPEGASGGEDDAAVLAALARRSSTAFALTAVVLLLCCGAHVLLHRLPSLQEPPPEVDAAAIAASQRHRRRRRDAAFAASAAQPLLDADGGAASDAEAACSGEEEEEGEAHGSSSIGAPAELLDGGAPAHAAPAGDGAAEAQAAEHAAELRLYKLGIFLTYIVSLCVYPDITAWLRPAAARGGGADGPAAANPPAVLPLGIRLRGDLLVPLTFVVFNTGDLLGRLSAAALPPLRARALLWVVAARAALPLALLSCNVAPPEGRWAAPALLARSDAAPLALLAALSLSNGALTAVAMTLGPACAPRHRRGVEATALTAWLVGGISCGSLVSMLVSTLLARR